MQSDNKTPSQVVHSHCGSPKVEDCGDASGQCYVCGGTVTRGTDVQKWMPSSFTGQSTVASPFSDYVCESCCFVMSRLSPVPGRPPKEGKDFGGNYRNYSHMWEDGVGYINASKGEKPLIVEFISRNHIGNWFCAIADSGQKHVLPYAHVNAQGKSGIVLFEEATVTIPEDTSLIATMSHLLTDGASKEEIERGDYRPLTWKRIGANRLREFEATHGVNRGHWFSLAIWLAQRDEETVQARITKEKESAVKKKAPKNDGKERKKATTRGRANRVSGDVPGPDASSMQWTPTDELLGTDSKRSKVVSSSVVDKRGVDNVSPEKVTNHSSVQLGLFSDW